MMGSVEPELVVCHPPLNRQFGIYPAAVIVMAGLLPMLTAACLWLLFLSANQLLVLAGWGWGNLILIRHETRWLPVAGAGLAWLALTLLFLWISARGLALAEAGQAGMVGMVGAADAHGV
jgi:hypothetical protein